MLGFFRSSFLLIFDWIGRVSSFGFRALRESVRPPFEPVEILRQIYQLGTLSSPLVILSGLAVGVVTSMHTRSSLERFGAEALIPTVLAIAMFSETGPIVTGLLVSGRVGAGIGAELGGMRVTEQIDALESLAVDSFKYLVVTRVIACILVMPLLTTMFNFAAITGGYFAETVISGMSLELYYRRAFSAIGFIDFIAPTLKTMVFGFIIATVSSYLGYTAKGGARGVGDAATRSVVFSSVVLIIVNVVLVKAIFFLFPGA
jgi:phospholipid/cholesterol/gamma-HCH transport system permease protein